MSPQELFSKHASNIVKNDQEALSFLASWIAYIHAVDDIEDEKTTTEHRMSTFIKAMELYTHPFFLKNAFALKQVIYSITSQYADSIQYKNSVHEFQRQYAEVARHCGAEMMLAVATIVGGYEHMRSISHEVRTFYWAKEHGE